MIIVFILVVIIGGVVGYLGFRLKYTKPKYQFEKTTTGRTVRFLEYSESKKHERNKILGTLLIFLGTLILGIGLMVLFFFSK